MSTGRAPQAGASLARGAPWPATGTVLAAEGQSDHPRRGVRRPGGATRGEPGHGRQSHQARVKTASRFWLERDAAQSGLAPARAAWGSDPTSSKVGATAAGESPPGRTLRVAGSRCRGAAVGIRPGVIRRWDFDVFVRESGFVPFYTRIWARLCILGAENVENSHAWHREKRIAPRLEAARPHIRGDLPNRAGSYGNWRRVGRWRGGGDPCARSWSWSSRSPSRWLAALRAEMASDTSE
jgi:hypothetical protein